jgi:hypothetical protein
MPFNNHSNGTKMNNKIAVILVLADVKYSLNDLEKHYKTFCGLYLVAFSVVLKKQLNLHLTYFSETLHLLHLKQKSPNPVENQSFS